MRPVSPWPISLPGALLLAAVLACPALLQADVQTPELSASSEVARAGYYQLRWALDEAEVARYRVEESTGPEFREVAVLYEGADRATVISGRGDGTYYYRVSATLGDGARSRWSNPLTVRVEHHSLGQAVFLFLLGAAVFIATVGLILAGTRKERSEVRKT